MSASGVVLDASAVLALLTDEPAGARVATLLDDASISTVNVAEVIAKAVDRGAPEGPVARLVGDLGVEIEPVTLADAVTSAVIRRHETQQRRPRLSMADRLCLALAARTGRTAVTADRAWTDVDLPVDVELIR